MAALQLLNELVVSHESDQDDMCSRRVSFCLRYWWPGQGVQAGQSCSCGRKEAEGQKLLQQDAFLPTGQTLAPPLGFRVNTYWKGQNNAFPALKMEIPIARAGFLRGFCGHILWGRGLPGRNVTRKREEGGRVWELLAMEAVKAPFQLCEPL